MLGFIVSIRVRVRFKDKYALRIWLWIELCFSFTDRVSG